MSTSPSSARPKRSRNSRGAGNQANDDSRRASKAAATPTVSVEQRHALIAATAYRRAERRGFQGGDAVADWLESEKEVDALLSRPTD